MHESIHEYVVSRLATISLAEVQRVAKDTGISESTIRKIKYKHTTNPGVSYVERLHRYFRDRPSA